MSSVIKEIYLKTKLGQTYDKLKWKSQERKSVGIKDLWIIYGLSVN